MSLIKVAVIGCGHWGPNYVRNFCKLPGVALACCCDLDRKNLDYIKNTYPCVPLTEDYRDILKAKDIPAVVVATPATTHYAIVRECLAHGKDVLAEKPLAMNSRQCLRLIDLAKKRKKILMVGHTFLFNPGITKIKEYITQKKLGRIYYMNAVRSHLGLVRQDVNAAWDLAPHDVSIFNYFTDTLPIAVSATGGCYLFKKKEDMAFINLVYPGGIVANIYVSWTDSNKERTIKVVGSRARAVFNDLDRLEMVKLYKKGIANERPYDDYGEFNFYLRDGDIISPKIDMVEPLRAMCSHFISCVRTRRQSPLAGGKQGLDVVKVMSAIDRSLKTNKVVSL